MIPRPRLVARLLAPDPQAPRSSWREWLRGAACGLLALALVVGIAELVAVSIGPTSTPVVAVGEKAVDLSPHWAKEFAIRHFGSHDKQALEAGIFATLIVIAAAVGVLAVRRLLVGVVAIYALAVVGALAAVSRPASPATAAIPSVVGGIVGAATLWLLLRGTLKRTAERAPAANAPRDGTDSVGGATATSVGFSYSRRRFLAAGAASVAVAAAAGAAGKALLSSVYSAASSRRAVRIPPATNTAKNVADAQADVPGISPFRTPNSTFYRVDTALVVPQVVAEGWSLRIHGMVDHEMAISYDDLINMPLTERDITLTCVSNPIGGPYVGNARWVGVLLAPLLQSAGVQSGADQILSKSADGWTCGTPVEAVMDGRDAMLAVEMNGEALPLEHGFPVRMIVPGIYGYASATKWLVDIELTSFAKTTAYWVSRGYAQEAPIKTMSRIDVPRALAKVPAGTVAVGGVAWAQRKGIAKVEVRVDNGPWQVANLATQDTVDTWRQWSYQWMATAGLHTIQARATDKTGYVQTEKRVGDLPNGATGWQSVVVTVT
jgi:DMSO/TMAO reductase YedYZ molybdopterin-dependent catalytic subunit